MKILQLTKKFPFPAKDGESVAVLTLTKALCELDCEISLLAMNTTKHFSDTDLKCKELSFYKKIDLVEIDNRLNPIDAFLNLFSQESYHVSRFVSKEYKEKLKQILKENTFDIIQLETLYLAPYIELIRTYSNAKIVMRSHNVEYEIWERISKDTSFLPKRKYIEYLTRKLHNFERSSLSKYDLLAAITQRDLDNYRSEGFSGKGITIPIGIDMNNYKPSPLSFEDELSLGFIGSLDWMPNVQGLKWFIDEIWPKIHEKFPTIKLHIAGRNCPDSLLQMKQPNIIVHGEVENAQAFILEHPIMIVPLRSGSGMRVKILEAMALGRIVITSSIGLEGIHAHHKKEVYIADSAAAYIDAISNYTQKKPVLTDMGERASIFIKKEFDNKTIGRKLFQEYQLLTKK